MQPLSRDRYIQCIAAWMMVLAIANTCFLAIDSRADERPNVILILADDLGGRDLGCYGSRFHQTPNIDRLASRGVRFINAYSASPLCSPTRCSIMTGLAPARVGITAPVCHVPQVILDKRLVTANAASRVQVAESLTRLDTKYTTLAELFQQAGYRTGHLGKWHLGSEPYSPLEHGFESDLPHTPGPGPGGVNGYFAPWSFWKGEGVVGEHIEDRMAQEAASFITANKDRSFFLNYWAFSVHSPWMAKADYTEQAERRVDPNDPQHNAMYAAMVRSLDEAVGTISRAVEDAGISQRTIIVFTSDNGGWHNAPKNTPRNPGYEKIPATSNAPFRSGKASSYEGGTHVPMIISYPSVITEGISSEAIVQSTDLFSTLIELANLESPAETASDGISIVTALKGEPLQRDSIFCHFPHGSPAQAEAIPGFLPSTWVRRGDWKLIRFYHAADDGSNRLELYNLREDPGETVNQVASQPELTSELDREITEYLDRTEAVIPKLNPNFREAVGSVSRVNRSASDPLKGWKNRGCDAVVVSGIAQLTIPKPADKQPANKQPSAATPFLGFAASKHAGASRVEMRIKSPIPFEGTIHWLPAGVQGESREVRYMLVGNQWETVAVDLPADGKLGIVRIYLPNSDMPVEIDWIEIRSEGMTTTKTDF